MSWCKQCGKYMLEPSRHTCPPAWDVLQMAYGEDDWEEASVAYGRTAHQAAEEWAARDDTDSAEYSIVAGKPADLLIKRQGAPETEAELLRVSGESVPEYTAEGIKSVRCVRHGCPGNTYVAIDEDHRPGHKCDHCAYRLEGSTRPPQEPQP